MSKIHNITLGISTPGVVEVEAGTELKLNVKATCRLGCNLQGQIIKIMLADDCAREIRLASFDSGTSETSEFRLRVPGTVGVHEYRVMFPQQANGQSAHEESSTSLTLNVKPHKTSLAVWDVASPTIVKIGTKIKVGAKCSAGCVMSDREIEIVDHNGASVTTAMLGSVPWPETAALYWIEADLPSPDKEGAYSWSVKLKSAGFDLPHESVPFPFGLTAVRAPEHIVTLNVVEKNTRIPIGDVQVRLGPHKGATAETGSAILEVPKGSYELNVWKAGYEAHSTSVDVSADTAVQIELFPAPEPETPYWMG